MTARAIRTPDWTYCAADISGAKKSASPSYLEWQLYDQRNDPHELVNLAGRKEYLAKAEELRGELQELLKAAGEGSPEIKPATLYP